MRSGLCNASLILACPAGVEPATYGLEGMKNLQRQYPTMVCSALVTGANFGSGWMESRVGVMVLTGVCRENRHSVVFT